MGKIWIILGLIVSLNAVGQEHSQTYKSYKFGRETDSRTCYIIDTLTGSKVVLQEQFNYGNDIFINPNYFIHGMLFVKISDMYGLITPGGKVFLGPSHFIYFNEHDSIISAYVCRGGMWVFLNFRGDTLSYGKGGNNTVPNLEKELNPTPFSQEGETAKWGYLNKKARWQIRPQFDDAMDFKDGKALVKRGGKWYTIDTAGKIK